MASIVSIQICAELDKAWYSMAEQGKARQGKARQGKARQGITASHKLRTYQQGHFQVLGSSGYSPLLCNA